jgi:hypothetical protein
MKFDRLLLIILFGVFLMAIVRLIAEEEWYLVASLISGLIMAQEDIRKLFNEEEKRDEPNA